MRRALCQRSSLVWGNAAIGRRFVSDPFNKSKPTSETHATEKTDPENNVQSDAVDKGMKEKKNATAHGGTKKTPEDTTRAPGPVIGMQDERGPSQSHPESRIVIWRLNKIGGKEH